MKFNRVRSLTYLTLLTLAITLLLYQTVRPNGVAVTTLGHAQAATEIINTAQDDGSLPRESDRVLSAPNTVSYCDVPENFWAAYFIHDLAPTGADPDIMPPLADAPFCVGGSVRQWQPGHTVARQDMVVYEYRLMKQFGWEDYTPAQQTFSDVPHTVGSNWREIETAVHYGVVQGRSREQCQAAGVDFPCFLPHANSRRDEMAQTVVRSGDVPSVVLPEAPHYHDAPSTNIFYSAIETGWTFDLARGYDAECAPNGTYSPCFLPSHDIGRAELAKLLSRLKYLLGQRDSFHITAHLNMADGAPLSGLPAEVIRKWSDLEGQIHTDTVGSGSTDGDGNLSLPITGTYYPRLSPVGLTWQSYTVVITTPFGFGYIGDTHGELSYTPLAADIQGYTATSDTPIGSHNINIWFAPPTPTATATPTATDTATPTSTATSTSTSTPTNTLTATDTATPLPTNTATALPSGTPMPSATPSPLFTVTPINGMTDRISGTVKTEAGNPAAGASLSLFPIYTSGPKQEVATATSDASGSFAFNLSRPIPPVGDDFFGYAVLLQPTPYTPLQASTSDPLGYVVHAGQVNFNLTSKPDGYISANKTTFIVAAPLTATATTTPQPSVTVPASATAAPPTVTPMPPTATIPPAATNVPPTAVTSPTASFSATTTPPGTPSTPVSSATISPASPTRTPVVAAAPPSTTPPVFVVNTAPSSPTPTMITLSNGPTATPEILIIRPAKTGGTDLMPLWIVALGFGVALTLTVVSLGLRTLKVLYKGE